MEQKKTKLKIIFGYASSWIEQMKGILYKPKSLT